jgi:hypothetical protein
MEADDDDNDSDLAGGGSQDSDYEATSDSDEEEEGGEDVEMEAEEGVPLGGLQHAGRSNGAQQAQRGRPAVQPGRPPLTQQVHVQPLEPLMANTGPRLKVRGFDATERKVFFETLMAYGLVAEDGLGSLDSIWRPFRKALPQRTAPQLEAYLEVVLGHLQDPAARQRDSQAYSDGVPKNATLKVSASKVLARLGMLHLVHVKLRQLRSQGALAKGPMIPATPAEASMHRGASVGDFWLPKHDSMLLEAAVREGYGHASRWQQVLAKTEELRQVVEKEAHRRMAAQRAAVGLPPAPASLAALAASKQAGPPAAGAGAAAAPAANGAGPMDVDEPGSDKEGAKEGAAAGAAAADKPPTAGTAAGAAAGAAAGGEAAAPGKEPLTAEQAQQAAAADAATLLMGEMVKFLNERFDYVAYMLQVEFAQSAMTQQQAAAAQQLKAQQQKAGAAAGAATAARPPGVHPVAMDAAMLAELQKRAQQQQRAAGVGTQAGSAGMRPLPPVGPAVITAGPAFDKTKHVHPAAAAAAAQAAAVGLAKPTGAEVPAPAAAAQRGRREQAVPLSQIYARTGEEQAHKARLVMAYNDMSAKVRRTRADTVAAASASKSADAMHAAAVQFRNNLSQLEVCVRAGPCLTDCKCWSSTVLCVPLQQAALSKPAVRLPTAPTQPRAQISSAGAPVCP